MADMMFWPSEEQKALWERLLAQAKGDYARRNLVLKLIEYYREPMEAVINSCLKKPIRMREPEHVRISSGVREYGACRLERRKQDVCSLTFSRHLFFEGNLSRLVRVVCHEMLHACLPFSEGHGKYFRFFMKKLNDAFGTQIEIHSPENAIQQAEHLYKYKVVCNGCGNVFYYLRAGSLVKHPERYRCTKCGESRFEIEQLR